MKELRFDGRTAIVTGAGGNPSLGRAHALLLASRGAKVVVNDIGGGTAPGPAPAQSVVDEIVALGGTAVADDNSVATPEGAAAIVKTCLDAFGQVDILVNNAGIIIPARFEEMVISDYQRTIDVNLMGPIYVTHAAWPHMQEKGYGRIVNITSASMFGVATHVAYSSSKGGLWSFTRALAMEGERCGIKVNALSPGAFTRMAIGSQEEDSPVYIGTKAHFPAEIVSPVVAYLAHDDCPVNGECWDSMGGSVSRVFPVRTKGISDPGLSIEKLAENWEAIMAESAEGLIPPGFMDGFAPGNKPYRPNTTY